MDEDPVVPLSDGQAGIAVLVRGAAARRDIATPSAAKGTYNVDDALGWSEGNQGHSRLLSPTFTPSPSYRKAHARLYG